MTSILIVSLTIFSLFVSVQAAYTAYLMLYTWNEVSAHEESLAPRSFRAPELSFSALLPARHEERVIGQTIERVIAANYPGRLLETIVICESGDVKTIAAAQEAIDRLASQGTKGARILTFNDGPINKPHGLNKGLLEARHNVVTVFDAEDEIHPEIFNVVNTVMLNEQVAVVQSGVQLMNHDSTWFAAHNVLEYYFWFKSRLHLHAKQGMTPLGGNSVFFATNLLRLLGGWDETNLTEDAEIGIRLSVVGERVRVVYDDAFVTKEETPPDVAGFIRQRTRWNQGFLQTLRKGTWWHVPHVGNRMRALFILSFPFVQALHALYLPFSLAMVLLVKLPIVVTLILLLPSYLLLAHCLLSVIGLKLFTRGHNLRMRPYAPLLLLATYFPYLCMLGWAALRALWREMRGINTWEKTEHLGVHRQLLASTHYTPKRPVRVLANESDTGAIFPAEPAAAEILERAVVSRR